MKKEQIRANRRAVAAQQPPACRSQAEVNETVCQGGFGREKVSDNEQMSLLFFLLERSARSLTFTALRIQETKLADGNFQSHQMELKAG